MNITYTPLFQIEIRHDYFVDGKCRHVVLEPDSETQKAMRQYQLLWRSEFNRHLLLFGKEAGNPPPVSMLHEPLTIHFDLQCTSPHFFNITDLPASFQSMEGARFGFYPRTPAVEDGSVRFLTRERTAGAGDLKEAGPKAGPQHVGRLGRLTVEIGKRNPLMVAPPDREGNVSQQFFQIAFSSRKVFWRYYFINQSNLDYDRMEVTDGKTVLPFTVGEPGPLRRASQVAVPILSQNAYPLQESSTLKPPLRIIAIGPERVTTLHLPTPEWNRLAAEGQGADHRFVSNMYIYL